MAVRKLTINNLSHSAGVISATLNGTTYSVTLGTLTALTRYMVYFTSSGLVVSTNVNSVGPAGAASWQLVGAFYTNNAGSPAFGSFVNITGVPKTQQVPYTVTYSSGTFTTTTSYWYLLGDQVSVFVDATNTAVGSGQYGMSVPFNIDVTKTGTTTSLSTGPALYNLGLPLGHFNWESSAGGLPGGAGVVLILNSSPFNIVFFASLGYASSALNASGNSFTDRSSGFGSSSPGMSTGARFRANFSYPSSVLSNTQLVDL